MTDKLKAVLSKLSQEEKTKKKVEEPIEEKEKDPEETPEETTDDLDDDDDDLEEDPEEIVTSAPKQELSEEEIQRLKDIDQEISRLRDHGVFNAELLFQIIKVNDNLNRIASFMEELKGKDAKK